MRANSPGNLLMMMMKRVGNARHRAMVAMVANDRRVTAFVLSMFKTNAKVLRSDLERCENAVGSRRS